MITAEQAERLKELADIIRDGNSEDSEMALNFLRQYLTCSPPIRPPLVELG